MKPRPIRFPQDGLAHDNIIEWWYFNGHLGDESGNGYAFMNCLIKSDVERVGLPFLSVVPFATHFTAHSVISDLARGKSFPLVDYVVLASKDSFTKPLLNINYANPVVTMGELDCAIEETDRFRYRVTNETMDLRLTSLKEPLLVGGTGFVDLHSSQTYYYSLTNLEAEGAIKVQGRSIDVTGKAWMDHQWADASYCGDRWTWFSIQLEGDAEMLCFEYDDGEVKSRLASISRPDGTAEHTGALSITPLGRQWVSPRTEARYPLAWRVQVPELDVDLQVDALLN